MFKACLSLKAKTVLNRDVVYELKLPLVQDLNFESSIEREDCYGAPIAAAMPGVESANMICGFPGVWLYKVNINQSWEDVPIQ